MKSYEELLAENKALVAQVYRMSEFIRLSAKKWEGAPEVEPTFCNLLRVANETPQQCLAEVRAETGRAGFIEGANSMKLAFQYGGTYNTQDKADQYAAKVRQGEQGTWLKDSNVNGGKRQGGE